MTLQHRWWVKMTLGWHRDCQDRQKLTSCIDEIAAMGYETCSRDGTADW